MKRQMIQKLLTASASLMACALLIGNTITVPTPTDGEGNSITIELPSHDNEDTAPEYSLLNDDDDWGENSE